MEPWHNLRSGLAAEHHHESFAVCGNADNYVVKTNQSFLNMLVSGLTCGIYTATQTKYYIPLKDAQK